MRCVQGKTQLFAKSAWSQVQQYNCSLGFNYFESYKVWASLGQVTEPGLKITGDFINPFWKLSLRCFLILPLQFTSPFSQFFKFIINIFVAMIAFRSIWRRFLSDHWVQFPKGVKRGGGTLLHELHRYERPQRVWFFSRLLFFKRTIKATDTLRFGLK